MNRITSEYVHIYSKYLFVVSVFAHETTMFGGIHTGGISATTIEEIDAISIYTYLFEFVDFLQKSPNIAMLYV